MKYCPNCNKELEDGVLFCDACGTQIPAEEPAAPAAETVFCENCGQQTDASAPFCQNCGAAIGGVAPEAPAKKKGFPKALLFGGIALVAVAAIVVALILILGGGRNNKYVAYLKDSQIWFSNFKESLEVSDDLFDSDELTKEDLYSKRDDIKSMIQMSANGKIMFYPDKIDDVDHGIIKSYTIYMRDVSDPESEAVKIDSDITSYKINKDGTMIAYMKDDTVKIGKTDGDKQKVADEITNYWVSEDFKTVIYETQDEATFKDKDGNETKYNEAAYFKWVDGEKEKIADGVATVDKSDDGQFMGSSIIFKVIEDKKLSKVAYMKDDVLYVHELGKDADKIDDEVVFINGILDNGNLLYTKAGTELKYVDYLNNDKKVEFTDDDKKITLSEDYSESLYLYDGEEAVLVCDNFKGFAAIDVKATNFVYVAYDLAGVKKLKTSESYSTHAVEKAINESVKYFVWTDAEEPYEIDLDDIYAARISEDGTNIYIMTVGKEKDKDDQGNEIKDANGEPKMVNKDEGEIYHIIVKKDAVEDPVEFDTDVCYKQGWKVEEDRLYYFKNYKKDTKGDVVKEKADLWVDGEEVESGVLPGAQNVTVLEDGSVIYYTDWDNDNEKQRGTLRIYNKKGEATTISDDVHQYMVTPAGEILYLKDYVVKDGKNKGDLYRYNDGKNEKIDTDVVAMLNIYVWEED